MTVGQRPIFLDYKTRDEIPPPQVVLFDNCDFIIAFCLLILLLSFLHWEILNWESRSNKLNYGKYLIMDLGNLPACNGWGKCLGDL